MEFQFQLNYNSTKLNEWTLDALHLAGIIAGKRRKTNESDSDDLRGKYFRGRNGSHCISFCHLIVPFGSQHLSSIVKNDAVRL